MACCKVLSSKQLSSVYITSSNGSQLSPAEILVKIMEIFLSRAAAEAGLCSSTTRQVTQIGLNFGQQIQQSGFLQHLPELASAAAERLQLVTPGDSMPAHRAYVPAARSSSGAGGSHSSSSSTGASMSGSTCPAGSPSSSTAESAPASHNTPASAHQSSWSLLVAQEQAIHVMQLCYRCAMNLRWSPEEFFAEVCPEVAAPLIRLACVSCQHVSSLAGPGTAVCTPSSGSTSTGSISRSEPDRAHALRVSVWGAACNVSAVLAAAFMQAPSLPACVTQSPHLLQLLCLVITASAYSSLLLQSPTLEMPAASRTRAADTGFASSTPSNAGDAASGGSSSSSSSKGSSSKSAAKAQQAAVVALSDPAKAWQFACSQQQRLPPSHEELLRLVGSSGRAMLWVAAASAAHVLGNTAGSIKLMTMTSISTSKDPLEAFMSRLNCGVRLYLSLMMSTMHHSEQQRQQEQQQLLSRGSVSFCTELLIPALMPTVMLYWAAAAKALLRGKVQAAVPVETCSYWSVRLVLGRLLVGILPAEPLQQYSTLQLRNRPDSSLAGLQGAAYDMLRARLADLMLLGDDLDSIQVHAVKDVLPYVATISSRLLRKFSSIARADGSQADSSSSTSSHAKAPGPDAAAAAAEYQRHTVSLPNFVTQLDGLWYITAPPQTQHGSDSDVASGNTSKPANPGPGSSAARPVSVLAEELAPYSVLLCQLFEASTRCRLAGVMNSCLSEMMFACCRPVMVTQSMETATTSSAAAADTALRTVAGGPVQQQLFSQCISVLKLLRADVHGALGLSTVQEPEAIIESLLTGAVSMVAEARAGAAAGLQAPPAAADMLPWLVLVGQVSLYLSAWVAKASAATPTVFLGANRTGPVTLSVPEAMQSAADQAGNALWAAGECGRAVDECLQWLQHGDNAAQLAAAGYDSEAVKQQLQDAAATLEPFSIPKHAWDHAVINHGVEQLQALGLTLTALAIPLACNNPACSNLSGASELQLVGGRSAICAGCLKARYCSRQCQREHWKRHKPVCKALAAAAVNSPQS